MGQIVKGKTRLWPRIRAALIALHVIGIVLASFPGSSKLGDKKRWKEPTTQKQIAMWGDRFRAWGSSLSHEELEAELWVIAQRYLRTREIVMTPFAPYGHVAPQAWGMFKAPSKEPTALLVEIDEGQGWRLVHRSRSPEHDYLSRTLGTNRFRKQIGRVGRRPQLFQDVGGWIARRTLDDFGAASRARVRVVRRKSPLPSRRADPVAEEQVSALVVRRKDLR